MVFCRKETQIPNRSRDCTSLSKGKSQHKKCQSPTSQWIRWISPIRITIDQLRATILSSSRSRIERIILVSCTATKLRSSMPLWNSSPSLNYLRTIRLTTLTAPTSTRAVTQTCSSDTQTRSIRNLLALPRQTKQASLYRLHLLSTSLQTVIKMWHKAKISSHP